MIRIQVFLANGMQTMQLFILIIGQETTILATNHWLQTIGSLIYITVQL